MIQVICQRDNPTPERLQSVLTTAGGCNLFGEPRFRLIWGYQWLGWIGGEWMDYDRSGNYIGTKFELRLEPRYLPPDRWYIVKWCPPELYANGWEQTVERVGGVSIHSLGPFPSRGDYELSWRMEINGEYLAPTASILREYVSRVMRAEQFSLWQRLVALHKREADKERAQEKMRESIFRERSLLGFVNPDSGKKSWSIQPKEIENVYSPRSSIKLAANQP